MAYLHVNPDYTRFLKQHGLHGPEDFLRMPGVIICGHPDRNVSRVALGTGADAMSAFLKKEHCVRWRDRLANAWAGFGLRSKSCREMALFRLLGQTGVRCPQVLAAGEVGGKAFVLMRAVDHAMDLRCALQQNLRGDERRRLARELGEALAGIHAAGFDQPDLYSKHSLVQHEAGARRFWFLDWQRSRRRERVTWSTRCRDLAALDATLSDELASDRERLTCLRAYLRAADGRGRQTMFARFARKIRRHAHRLLRRRYVRELRQAPLRPQEQSLIWLDGEAVCVTPQFHADMGARLPAWLELFRSSARTGTSLDRLSVSLTAHRAGCLVRRRETRRWRWLWDWLRAKRPTTPELEQAGTLFRLERYGIALPRVLAMGQRHERPWHAESFLLTETEPGQIDLTDWLADRQAAGPVQRRQALRQAGALLRRLHQAGYYLDSIVNPRCLFAIQTGGGNQPKLSLSSAEGLRRSRAARPRWARQDLQRLHASFSLLCSRAELLCFFLAYLGRRRLDAEAKKTLGTWPRSRIRQECGRRCKPAFLRMRLRYEERDHENRSLSRSRRARARRL
jgi:tRNA A-37 threonylcarbamoyl transferase component Bud32